MLAEKHHLIIRGLCCLFMLAPLLADVTTLGTVIFAIPYVLLFWLGNHRMKESMLLRVSAYVTLSMLALVSFTSVFGLPEDPQAGIGLLIGFQIQIGIVAIYALVYLFATQWLTTVYQRAK